MIASLAWLLLALAAPPSGLLLAELLFAGRLPTAAPPPAPAPFAVIVPAHDEAAGIAATVGSIRAGLRPGDRLLVVADNCRDETAAIAERAGATVTVRHAPTLRGKGYALDHGRAALAAIGGAFGAVIVVDADCAVAPGSLARLAAVAEQLQRPVQARYLMEPPPDPTPAQRIAAFAFRVKNLVRPLGASRLGLPVLLAGTGMAFPSRLFATLPLGNGEIVEDLVLTIDLARRGCFVAYCPDALVTSRFPAEVGATAVQRRRWEHGALSAARRFVPALLASAVRRGSPRALLLAVEVAIPPLSLVVMGWAGIVALTGLWFVASGEAAPLIAAGAICALLAGALLIAWHRHARDLVAPALLLRLPLYALAKIPGYGLMLRTRTPAWERTGRDGMDEPDFPSTPGSMR